jgi:hypothetical protein
MLHFVHRRMLDAGNGAIVEASKDVSRDVVQIVWIKDKLQCRQKQAHALREKRCRVTFIRFSNAGGDHSVILEGFATIYWVTLLDSIVAIGLFHDAGKFNILVMRSCGIGALSVQWFSSPCLRV